MHRLSLAVLAALARAVPGLSSNDAIEWASAWPKSDGPGYGGASGAFSSPFVSNKPPDSKAWSFAVTGLVRSGVVLDDRGRMYVAATAAGGDAFPYMYCVDLEENLKKSTLSTYVWLEPFDITGAAIHGAPIVGYEGGRQVVYVAATAPGTSTDSDNTYVYAFATNSSVTTPANRRTELLWTYPPAVSAAYSNLGAIRGNGALHRNGTLMYGTAARGGPGSGGFSGVVALGPFGEFRWRFETPLVGPSPDSSPDSSAAASGAPVETSLVVDGSGGGAGGGSCCDQVYFVASSGSFEASLFAVRVADGSLAWSVALEASPLLESAPAAPPALGPFQDVLVGFGEKIYSVDRRSGRINWVEVVGAAGAFAAAPAVHGNNYFIGNLAGRLYHLKAKDDNSGLKLKPTSPGDAGKQSGGKSQKGLPSEMTRGLSQLLSSPVVFGGGEGIIQVDLSGKMVAYKFNGKSELWRLTLGQTVSDSRQLAVARDGTLLLGVGGAVRGYGGGGGCRAGSETGSLAQVREGRDPNGMCLVCGAGNISEKVGSAACSRCPAGEWASKEAGQTFCFKCPQEAACPGGNTCARGHRGALCAACAKGYYRVFNQCSECPTQPFFQTLAVLLGLVLALNLYMHFTRGTNFAYEVARGDVLAVYVPPAAPRSRAGRCLTCITCGLTGPKAERVERKVLRVIDDYSLEVSGSFGNTAPIKNAPYWVTKCRVYGDEVRAQGNGRVTIQPDPKALLAGDEEEDEGRALTHSSMHSGEKNANANTDGAEGGLGGGGKGGAGSGPGSVPGSGPEVAADTGGLLSLNEADQRSLVWGKSQSVGTEVLMAASLIAVGYMQSSALLVEVPGIGWPFHYERIFGVFARYLYLDLPSLAVSPDCQWDWSYSDKWYATMTLPILLLGGLGAQYYTYNALVPHVLIRKKYQNKVINAMCITMVLLYVFVTAKTIEPFACTTWPDGTATLDKDPNIECKWTEKGYFSDYAVMALWGLFFFFFYGLGIPLVLLTMLSWARANHTMGTVTTREQFGWIYIRFADEYYFWEILIMVRKFFFVVVVLLTGTPRETMGWCLAVNLGAMAVQLYYRPYNCFDCLLSRSRRCFHWGAMDQLEVGMLLSQTLTLSVGLHFANNGRSVSPSPDEPLDPLDLVVLCSVALSALLLGAVIFYLSVKTWLKKKKVKSATEKNEYATAQNMNSANLDAVDFFCGC